MLITEDIFQAFLKCETKAYLKILGVVSDQCDFIDWQQRLAEDYKRKGSEYLRSNCSDREYRLGASIPQDFEGNKYRLFLDCVVDIIPI